MLSVVLVLYIYTHTYTVVFSVQWDIGKTALHKVSGIGDTALVTLLLEHGASVYAVDVVCIHVISVGYWWCVVDVIVVSPSVPHTCICAIS